MGEAFKVSPEKEWALGLTQLEFEREWALKFPFCDVIPLGEEWVKIIPPGEKGIDAIPPTYEYQPDGPAPKVEAPIIMKEKAVGKNIIPKLNKQDFKKSK